MNALAALAHPGHEHFKLDEKSGLWLPLAVVGVLVTLAILAQVLRTWRRQ
jgi:hypothetical protein